MLYLCVKKKQHSVNGAYFNVASLRVCLRFGILAFVSCFVRLY